MGVPTTATSRARYCVLATCRSWTFDGPSHPRPWEDHPIAVERGIHRSMVTVLGVLAALSAVAGLGVGISAFLQAGGFIEFPNQSSPVTGRLTSGTYALVLTGPSADRLRPPLCTLSTPSRQAVIDYGDEGTGVATARIPASDDYSLACGPGDYRTMYVTPRDDLFLAAQPEPSLLRAAAALVLGSTLLAAAALFLARRISLDPQSSRP